MDKLITEQYADKTKDIFVGMCLRIQKLKRVTKDVR